MPDRAATTCSTARRALLLGLALLALSAGPAAAAAPPITLDSSPQALKPELAIDPAGTAHIVWVRRGPTAHDDKVIYCKLPRGARKCVVRHELSAPLDSNGPAYPRFHEDGRLLIISARCCDSAFDNVFIFTSHDNGASFGPAVEAGRNEATGDAEVGPGPFNVATVSATSTGGVLFEVAPISGPPPPSGPTRGIRLGDDATLVGAAYNGQIAFLDPLTPIVAMDDLEKVYFRRFLGGLDYHATSAWSPLTTVAAGDEVRLAGLPGGKKGVHLLMRVGKPGRFRLVARRFNGVNFAKPSPVTRVGDPISHSFAIDPSGRLHAAWHENKDDSLRYRHRPAGKGWAKEVTLLPARRAERVFTTRLAAAKDGGGLVVWDNNFKGPLRAIRFGPTGPVGGGGGGGGCVGQVKVGGATVTAQEGCLKRSAKNPNRYTTDGDVRVNGIDLRFVGAAKSVATASAVPRLTVDRKARTLVTSVKAEAKVGNILLGREKIAWRLPAKKGEIRDLAGNPASLATGKHNVPFLGLPVSGYTVPSIDGAETVRVPVNVKLPAPFNSVLGESATGTAMLRASNDAGLILENLRVRLENIALGIALIEKFDLTFVDEPSVLEGSTSIKLPPAGAKLGADFRLAGGDFEYGRGSFTFPPGSLAVATDIFLRQISFEVAKSSSCTAPTRIGGGVRFVAGPEVAGFALVAVDGTVAYRFPKSSCGKPGVLEIGGKGEVLGIPVGHAWSKLTSSGNFTFGTSLKFDAEIASAYAGIEGGVDIPSATFYATGKGGAAAFGKEFAGAEAIASSKGMAMCGKVFVGAFGVGVPVEMGFEYSWGEEIGIDNFDAPPDCDFSIGAYKPVAFQSSAIASGGSAGGGSDGVGRTSAVGALKLPAGLPSATIRVDGITGPTLDVSGAPGVKVTGPKGLAISHAAGAADTVVGSRYAVVSVGGRKYVKLMRPAPGAYRVEGAGEVPVTTVAVAHGLPAPKVTGWVRQAGRRGGRARLLRWQARPIAGQTIEFVEEGGGGLKAPLGKTVKGRRGGLRFRPASGSGGRRTVYAIVSQSGVPRARLRVASFKAPSALPGRVRGARLRRVGKSLLVSWKRAPGAAKVAVSWALADGRRQATVVSKGRRLKIRRVPGIDSGRIRVAGLLRDNVAGPAVRLKLKAKPKRLKSKREKPKRRGSKRPTRRR